ncbi:MAG: amidase family protein [Alphaproteobacteria bacterium]
MPWNFTEQPAISINAAFTRTGLPIGVQIIGRRFDDHGVLKMAKGLGNRARPDHQLAQATERMIPKSLPALDAGCGAVCGSDSWAKKTDASEPQADVIRCVWYADQRARQLIWRVPAHSR